MNVQDALGQRLLLSFRGLTAPDDLLQRVRRGPLGGVSLFRSLNVRDPEQVLNLTSELQAAARSAGHPPLLISADQEGGQLMALGDATTPFPGNMALGAAGSADLASRVGRALGRECAAMGVNVNYAPVCDVNSSPLNPVVGVRSFGENPDLVARLAAAMVTGLQSVGVAASAKHFPGHGDTSTDSHYATPTILHDLARLRGVELPPFVAAIEAGVKMMMLAHVALPALTGSPDLPATLSRSIAHDLLRGALRFQGVVVSDSLDMVAIHQGPGLPIDVIAAAAAGVDLLLLGPRTTDHEPVFDALVHAAQRGLIAAEAVSASAERVLGLKRWLAQAPPRPSLALVGCAEHRALAAQVAAQSITLVRDDGHVLPLRPSPEQRIVVVLPRLTDLTPADTSSYVEHRLFDHVRHHHPHTIALDMPAEPTAAATADLVDHLNAEDVVIVGTLNATAQPGQAAMVKAILARARCTVVAALRLPYDLAQFPEAPTYLCTYSVLEPSMQALAAVLFGAAKAHGRLPVSIPGLYALGHGMTT